MMQLNRSHSMTRAYEFAGVRNGGVSSAGRFLVVSILEDSSLETSRFGIICTRKVCKAHCRNLLRRRVREIIRTQGEPVSKGLFVVTVLRWRAAEASYEELEKDWSRAIRRLKRGEGRPPSERAGGNRGKKGGKPGGCSSCASAK